MADLKYIYLYNRRKGDDIKKFIDAELIYDVEPKELLDYNRDLIWQQYSEDDRQNEKNRSGKWLESSADLSVDSILPCPCSIRLESKYVTAEISINQTNAQTDTADYYAFADEKIQEIYQNEGYVVGSTTKRNLDCHVFGWFKTNYYLGTSLLNNRVVRRTPKRDISEFVDLSKYIMSMSTTVTSNGGSFILRLPIISAKRDYTAVFDLKNDAALSFGHASDKNTIHTFGGRGEFFSKTSFNDQYSNFFNYLISSNDLLFLSYEKLDMELDRVDYEEGDSDYIFNLNTVISNHVYDMIGLVDEVKVVTNAASAEAYVEVTGRDLMKLLIEDGTFFFNPSTTSDPSSVFCNEQSYGEQGDVKDADMMNNEYNNPVNRIRGVTGQIDIFANRGGMNIGYILKGVISQLANVEVVPGYVFESWKSKRTKYTDLEPKE